jgi:2-keto-4-pentenoate hydratase/2-oxohepta-3-ene-1,7-dioic acid hydratase in catechol pathway
MTQAVRFVGPAGEPRLGRLEGSHLVDAGPAPEVGFAPTAENWAKLEAANGERLAVDGLKLLSPVYPRKILAIGLNYKAHADESDLDVPPVPVVFAIWPTAVTGPHDPIVVPVEETRPDFEGEVAVVIGKPAYRVSEADAPDYIGGITAFNDVSGRRAQLETPLRQFTVGKSFDTFAPLGPCISSMDGIDIDNIRLKTTLSGEVMQDATTSQLIFRIPSLIEYLSKGITLEPGDVIATGTPGGVGDTRDPRRYLQEGDLVEVWVEHVGSLANPVTMERM